MKPVGGHTQRIASLGAIAGANQPFRRPRISSAQQVRRNRVGIAAGCRHERVGNTPVEAPAFRNNKPVVDDISHNGVGESQMFVVFELTHCIRGDGLSNDAGELPVIFLQASTPEVVGDDLSDDGGDLYRRGGVRGEARQSGGNQLLD